MCGKKRGNETVYQAAYGGMTNSFGIMHEARHLCVARLAISIKPRNSR